MSPTDRRLASLAVRRYSLAKWKGLNPPPSSDKDWGVTLPSQFMATVFDRMLPSIAKNRWTAIAHGGVASFLRDADAAAIERVRAFFDIFKEAIAIEDLTRGSFALSANFSFDGEIPKRTLIGNLVNAAKPYNATPTPQHNAAASELGDRMARFLENGCIGAIDSVIAVPPSDPKKAYSPRILAARIAEKRGIDDLTDAIVKTRQTRQLKNLSKLEKAMEVAGSIRVDPTAIAGRTILVVDDLYQSGTTLNFVALELEESGAEGVFGFAAVKTMRNTDNQPVAVDDDDDPEVPL